MNESDPAQRTVLIVGAGPSGLAAGLECARLGHPFRLIERSRGRPPFSKALAINPRTLDCLEDSGATAAILERARLVPGACLWDGNDRLGGFEFAGLRDRYSHMTALPQSETEDALEERLGELGGRVERGVALVGLEENGAGVRCRFDTGETTTAAFVVGADGARSTVRRELGITMKGDELPGTWGLADARLEGYFDPDRANVATTDFGFLFALRIRDDLWRLASNVPDFCERLPSGLRIRDTVWRSEFHVEHRVAERFGTSRVLLVGDAAHLHSPLGGRGMNLGVEDAVLGIRALGPRGWPEAHRQKRRRKAKRVVAFVRRQTVQAMGTNPLVRRFRATVAPVFLRFSPIQRFAARFVLGSIP